ncbi:hypothetical protein CL653_02535 [bacterium]|nr:hypothetical protein [bacterium]
MKSTPEFEQAYRNLNPKQKQAVDTIEGPVMVVAGPGTGKTQILTLRIANILLKTDTNPENILALTFTDSGVKAMRNRLRKYVGSSAFRVPIYTFHGFVEKLAREYPENLSRLGGGRVADEVERVKIIKDILDGGEIKKLRPGGKSDYYLKPVKGQIDDLKSEFVRPDDLRVIIDKQTDELAKMERFHEKGAHKGKQKGDYTKKAEVIEKNEELLFVYRQYEAFLLTENLYDFNDMLIEAVRAMESSEGMLYDLQEVYQYVLADEHQDVNGTQNKLLELLMNFHESPNLFVVGDEKQGIYRFQGASLENFLYFENHFKDTTVISLEDNYRSGQEILDAGHSLIKVDEGPLKDLRIPLKAVGVRDSDVYMREFSHVAVERDWLVEAVQKELKKGTPGDEIAIIVRKNKEVEEISAHLRSKGINVHASADSDILEHPITVAVLELLNAVIHYDNDEVLAPLLLNLYWGIAAEDVVKVLSARNYNNPLWMILNNSDRLKSLELKDISKVENIAQTLKCARDSLETKYPTETLELLLKQSGFLDHVIATSPIEGSRVVRRIYDEVEEMSRKQKHSTLKDLLLFIEMLRSYNLPLKAPYIMNDDDAVSVMTAHKSKGLEFGTVFIPQLVYSTWSGSKVRKNFDVPLLKYAPEILEKEEDERRLLYVAMTRAKRNLHLSFSNLNSAGKELQQDKLLDGLDTNLYTKVDTDKEEKEFEPLDRLQSGEENILISLSFLRQVLKDKGFSATSLNNYLKSPWNYIFRNALHYPETQSESMLFGSLAHSQIEQITRKRTVPTPSELKDLIELDLGKLIVNDIEYTRLHERLFESITAYGEHLIQGLAHESKEEFTINVTLPTGIEGIPELTLTGKLDRLDFDKQGNLLRVVDYKTGKPRSRNDIEGKTKGSDGGYKRQLVFYALLLELYGDERYQPKEFVLSFVEPNQKGKIVEESFVVTKAEIEILKEEIIKSAEEIYDGSCLKQSCDSENSDYCYLVERMTNKKCML